MSAIPNRSWAWSVAACAGMAGAGALPAMGQGDGPSLITEMIGRVEAGETGPRTAEEAIDLARRCVFRLQAYESDGMTRETLGGGFLISADGLAITRASMLPSQGRYQALINEDGIPLSVHVVAVDAAADLALIRLEMPEGGIAFPHIEPVEEPVPDGSSVWAVCFDGPRPCRLDQTGGVELLPKEMAVSEGSRWLAITGSLGGGACEPIINIKGQVVGITTSLSDPDTGVSYALAADDLRSLLSLRRGPVNALNPSAEAEPMPTLVAVESVPAVALAGGVEALRKVRGRADEPLDGEGLCRQADRWLPLLAAADEEDEALPAKLADLTAALDQLALRGPQPLAEALAPMCAGRLSDPELRAGTAILAAGETLNGGFYGLRGEAGVLMQCGEHVILLTDLRISPDSTAPVLAPGRTVLAGGLFAGYIWRNDQTIAVVQHGFARTTD